MTPDPGPVASGRRAIDAHVDANRPQRFSRGPAAAVIAICEKTVYFLSYYNITINRS